MALCLSGGGPRAMVFHVGALWRLNEAGLLPRLDRVSSVSGGSITAGTNWAGWKGRDRNGEAAGPAVSLRCARFEVLARAGSATQTRVRRSGRVTWLKVGRSAWGTASTRSTLTRSGTRSCRLAQAPLLGGALSDGRPGPHRVSGMDPDRVLREVRGCDRDLPAAAEAAPPAGRAEPVRLSPRRYLEAGCGGVRQAATQGSG